MIENGAKWPPTWPPESGQNAQKSGSEGVPESDWISDGFREPPETGRCGPNAINSISNSLSANSRKVRFWSHFGLRFRAHLG
mgnify:CR=1 FL=1